MEVVIVWVWAHTFTFLSGFESNINFSSVVRKTVCTEEVCIMCSFLISFRLKNYKNDWWKNDVNSNHNLYLLGWPNWKDIAALRSAWCLESDYRACRSSFIKNVLIWCNTDQSGLQRSCPPSQGSSGRSTWSTNYTNCPDLVAIFFCLPISVHNTNLRNSFCIMVYDGTEHLLGHKQPWLEEKTHPNIYNGKVCECCSQTSKQVNIVVTRMRGPSGPEILVLNTSLSWLYFQFCFNMAFFAFYRQ